MVITENTNSQPDNVYNAETMDNTACNGPFVKNYPSGEAWIAVIQRGKCTFNQKIANALKLNASGVLIYDNDNSGALQSMKVELFKIPSVFTFSWKGQEIVNLIQNFGKVFIGFNRGSHCRSVPLAKDEKDESSSALPDSSNDTSTSSVLSATVDSNNPSQTKILYCGTPDAWSEFHDILKKQTPFWNWNLTKNLKQDTFNVEKKFSVMFVSVSFVVLMVISMAWLMFYYIQRFRKVSSKDKQVLQLILRFQCFYFFTLWFLGGHNSLYSDLGTQLPIYHHVSIGTYLCLFWGTII